MMVWKSELISEVLEQIKTGSTPSTLRAEFFGGSIPWFTPADIGSTRDLTKSLRYITEAAIGEGKANLFDENMLLITCIGDLGRVGILKRSASSNQQITALKFCSKIDVRFAYYWFIAHQHILEQRANQAIVPIVNTTRLQEIDFSYPSLQEQKRIVSILEKADRLRQQGRYALELSSTYLPSVFLELFGDPVTNLKNWNIQSLISVSQKFSDGPFGSNLKTEHYTSSGIRVIRLQNIGIGQLIDQDKAYISESHFASLDKHRCLSGDVIIGTLGDPNLRACILPTSIAVALNKQTACR